MISFKKPVNEPDTEIKTKDKSASNGPDDRDCPPYME